MYQTILFIAKRLSTTKKGRLSASIIQISSVSVALGILVMLISISTLEGFKSEISKKIYGFSGQLKVSSSTTNESYESTPLLYSDSILNILQNNSEVVSVSTYITKPAIVQTPKDTLWYRNFEDIDTFRIQREIEGIVVKGVSNDYDWSFIESKLVDGRIPYIQDSINEIIISKVFASKLGYKVGDRLNAFFLKQTGPVYKGFQVVGIYNTGLVEFDKQLAYTSLRVLQEVNQWGIRAKTTFADSCRGEYFILEGGYDSYIINNPEYKWSNTNKKNIYKQYLTFDKDTTITFTVSEGDVFSNPYSQAKPSTAIVKVKVERPCNCKDINWETAKYEAIGDTARRIILNNGVLIVEEYTEGNTFENFIGAYEVYIRNPDLMDSVSRDIHLDLPLVIKSESVRQMYLEIFSWMDYLNINLYTIILMMIIVAVINMTSTILVMILEKKNTISILKTLGANNKTIQISFVASTGFIIVKSLIYGNILALIFLFIQYKFQLITLNPEVYFVETVPIAFNLSKWILINMVTLIICLVTMLLPSIIISSIKPGSVLRFK